MIKKLKLFVMKLKVLKKNCIQSENRQLVRSHVHKRAQSESHCCCPFTYDVIAPIYTYTQYINRKPHRKIQMRHQTARGRFKRTTNVYLLVTYFTECACTIVECVWPTIDRFKATYIHNKIMIKHAIC